MTVSRKYLSGWGGSTASIPNISTSKWLLSYHQDHRSSSSGPGFLGFLIIGAKVGISSQARQIPNLVRLVGTAT